MVCANVVLPYIIASLYAQLTVKKAFIARSRTVAPHDGQCQEITQFLRNNCFQQLLLLCVPPVSVATYTCQATQHPDLLLCAAQTRRFTGRAPKPLACLLQFQLPTTLS